MAIQVTDLHMLRDQLVVRRQKLQTAVAKTQTANLLHLLEQVDHALERADHGSYGVCEHCAGTVEPERLFADPMVQLCLDCLKPAEQRALEQDLLLAARPACCPNATFAPQDGKWPITMSRPVRSAAIIATSSSMAKIFISWWETFPARAWPQPCSCQICMRSSGC